MTQPGQYSILALLDETRNIADIVTIGYMLLASATNLVQQLSHRAYPAMRLAALTALLATCIASGLAQDRQTGTDEIMVSVTRAQNEGRLLDAEKILADAIAAIGQAGAPNQWLGTYLSRLGMLVGRRGDSTQQMALYRRALDADRSAFGPTSLRVANDFDEIVSAMLMEGGKDDEAEALQEQALEIARLNETNLKSSYVIDGVGSVLGQAGIFYLHEHRWSEVESLLSEMKRVCDSLAPHPGVALACDGYPTLLAELYRGEGRTAEVERQSTVQMGRPLGLANLENAAEQYEKDGLYVEAEVSYRQAIAWIQSHRVLPTGIGLGTSILVEEYNRLGGALQKQGRADQAEATYKGAIELQETAEPREAEDVSSFNFSPLLNFYRVQGRLGDIEPMIKNAILIQEQRLGPQSVRLVQTLLSLADVYQEEGQKIAAKYTEAQPLYERALVLQQAAVGPEHPRLLLVLDPYAALLRRMSQDTKAAELQARIDRINQLQQEVEK